MHSRGRILVAGICLLAAGLLLPGRADAVGTQMFTTVAGSTGEKPQSKLWYHDGSYWAILRGPSGVAFYEKVGSNWQLKTFANAVVTSSGHADVKWNGTDLFVLVYAATSRLYKYSYATATRSYVLVSGFPVTLPNPSGSETMVLEQDSSGRLWTTAEGNGNINVYYSTSADHRTWSSTPFLAQTGVDPDDISTIVAFGGDKIGVFWSDQSRWTFGFRVHQDSASPTTWGSVETVVSGTGVSDDHVNVAADAAGRVYAVTKDAADALRVHRRAVDGTWTTRTNVLGGGTATRPIIQIAEADAKVYILFTRWGVTPERIEHRVADMATLTFASTTNFISTTSNMNNVTGLKQPLPLGNIIAVAENGTHCWFNSVGSLPSAPQPPGPPSGLVASAVGNPLRIELAWSAPSTGTPDGYNVYRQVSGGSFTKLNAALVTGTTYNDTSPPGSPLCYNVRAVDGGLEGNASNTACYDNTPLPPPGEPRNLTVELYDVSVALQLAFNEASGQVANDGSGNGNHARLGSGTGTDSADPAWITGVSGAALEFDGNNDYLEIADAASLDPAGGFTVESWVRVADGAGTGTLVAKGDTGARTVRIRLVSGGDIEFRWDTTTGSSRVVTADAVIEDDAWHHIACVYDQAEAENRIYLDGVLVASAGATGIPATNSAPLHVGARFSGSFQNFLEGAIDDLRILPQASSAAAVQAAMRGVRQSAKGATPGIAAEGATLAWDAPLAGAPVAGYWIERAQGGGAWQRLNSQLITARAFTDGILTPAEYCYRILAQNSQGLEGPASASACAVVLPPLLAAPVGFTAELTLVPGTPPAAACGYDFAAGTGQTIADVTGNGHAGQLGSTPQSDDFDPRWTGGILGACLRFDGSNDRVSVADAPGLQLTASFTLEAWVLLQEASQVRTILAKGLDATREYGFAVDAAGALRVEWRDASATLHQLASSSPVSTGIWHHVAAVYDATSQQARLYVDGQPAGIADGLAPPIAGTGVLFVGAARKTTIYGDHFAGSIDLLRVVPAALYDTAFAPPHDFAPPSSRRVDLAWTEQAVPLLAGYNVYRQVGVAAPELLSAALVQGGAFTDHSPPSTVACYTVAPVDTLAREGAATDDDCITDSATDAGDTTGDVPPVFRLALGASPNPFNPTTTLAYAVPHAGHVRIAIYDSRGRRVAVVVDAERAAGRYQVRWDAMTPGGRAVPTGVYFAEIVAGAERVQRKLVLIR